MTPLWIVGAGGHGSVVAEAALLQGPWTSVEFFDDRWPQASIASRAPVTGNLASMKERLQSHHASGGQVVIAVGNNITRLSLSVDLEKTGARLATVIHPAAVVSRSATVRTGSVVLAGAVINPYATIGRACILNTRASVDHDCELEDGVHICPGVSLAGNVIVRECAWVGIGASVIQGIEIGRQAIVGAGAAVIENVREGSTVVGCPAREPIRA